MKVIVVGCGQVGAELARLLDLAQHQVTVLDREETSFEKLPDGFKGEARLGDGTDGDTLVEAGGREADALVALTEQDNRNILVAQLARHIYNVSRVCCRINDPERSDFYQGLGLETVSPTRVIAQLLLQRLVG